MSKKDFSGTEFDYAPGSVHGLRSWDMDSFGRLTGVTHKEVWTPGENVSTCKATRKERCPSASIKEIRKREESSYSLRWEPSSGRRTPIKPCGKDLSCYDGYHVITSDHSFDPSCECGFWAYFEDGFNSHADIVGVIEAYGKVTIGTKGFRAEKARIVAFATKSLSRTKVTRLAELYPDAAHYATADDLVQAFPDLVNYEWEPVGEGFWTKMIPAAFDHDHITNLYLGMNSFSYLPYFPLGGNP